MCEDAQFPAALQSIIYAAELLSRPFSIALLIQHSAFSIQHCLELLRMHCSRLRLSAFDEAVAYQPRE